MNVRSTAISLLFCSVLCRQRRRNPRKIVSALGGEPLARVQVEVLETGRKSPLTATNFHTIASLLRKYTLRFNAVGYRLVRVPFTLAADEETKQFDITVPPTTSVAQKKVEVKGDVFQGRTHLRSSRRTITASEIRDNIHRLADDPFERSRLCRVSPPRETMIFTRSFLSWASPSRTPAPTSTHSRAATIHGLTNISEGATLSL